MVWLVDTNVALRWSRREDPDHAAATSAVRALKVRGETLRITTQNLVEFWNVCTRPVAKNGFGLPHVEAARNLAVVEALFPLAPDNEAVYPAWKRLIMRHGVSGVQVHDARLAAFMEVYEIPNILTFNTKDFARYAGIAAVNPRDIVSVV